MKFKYATYRSPTGMYDQIFLTFTLRIVRIPVKRICMLISRLLLKATFGLQILLSVVLLSFLGVHVDCKVSALMLFVFPHQLLCYGNSQFMRIFRNTHSPIHNHNRKLFIYLFIGVKR